LDYVGTAALGCPRREATPGPRVERTSLAKHQPPPIVTLTKKDLCYSSATTVLLTNPCLSARRKRTDAERRMRGKKSQLAELFVNSTRRFESSNYRQPLSTLGCAKGPAQPPPSRELPGQAEDSS
jgi:hypothetical protein